MTSGKTSRQLAKEFCELYGIKVSFATIKAFDGGMREERRRTRKVLMVMANISRARDVKDAQRIVADAIKRYGT